MANNKKQSIGIIINSALNATRQYITKEPEKVIEVDEANGEWTIIVEALERKAVPDSQDILGRYEVKLNLQGELLGWKQKMIRKRSDRLMAEEEYKARD